MNPAKTVLITGSTRGIGLEIARTFASTGEYNLVLNGVEANGSEIANAVAAEFGIPLLFSSANLLRVEELRKMTEEAIARFGKIDVLVNNAGIQHVSPVEDFSDERWLEILGLNLTAPFYLTKAVWKSMKEQRFGRIINIASAHGLAASAYKSAYVASKHGLVGFTKTIALEGAPFGITANAICPGYVRTPLVDMQIADQAKAHQLREEDVISKIMLSRQAVKEFIPATLIGQMALFISSEKAGTLTGAALSVDGGWTAQ